MAKEFVELVDQNYRIIGSRVSFESVILAFWEELSPETIAAECFPTLTLERVYGVITFYLSNRPEVDSYLKNIDGDFKDLRKATHNADPEFSRKLSRAKRQLQLG